MSRLSAGSARSSGRLACFGGAFAPGLRNFFASRLLLGVGEAPTFPANSKATGYWFPRKERSLATAIFDSSAKLAAGIGTLTIGMVVIHFGWRFAFAVTGVASLLYFLAFFVLYRDPDKDNKALARAARIPGAQRRRIAGERAGLRRFTAVS